MHLTRIGHDAPAPPAPPAGATGPAAATDAAPSQSAGTSPPPTGRDALVAALAERTFLWPLAPCRPCRRCGLPRRPPRDYGFGTCERCRELHALYGDALAALHPLALTTRDWALGAALRRFKDHEAADPGAETARFLGAVLSSYLEARLTAPGAFGLEAGPALITAVPSSRPAVTAALDRAQHEGWWTPVVHDVATARPGLPRQRERSARERVRVAGKWEVDAAAVRGLDVLVLDDLYTTGGTVHSFALALREAGARSVRAAVLALNVGDHGAWILPALRARHAAGLRWTPFPSLRERCGR